MKQMPQRKFVVLKASLLISVLVMAALPAFFYSQTHIEVSEAKIKNKSVATSQDQPLHDVDVPNFLAMRDISARKQAFFGFLKPAIEQENERLAKLRETVQLVALQLENGDSLSNQQLRWLSKLADTYRVDSEQSSRQQLAQLLIKIDQIPVDLVLVQAANESAWGSSRFARMGLNFFGIWCFKKGCGMVPNARDSGLSHEVAAFDSVNEVIGHYFLNINSHSAYSMLREIRAQLRAHNLPLQANILATGLVPYSERGIDYVVEINAMLRHNRRYL
ncbi:glucosaminidase domain-containing protein [Thalassotalea ponticola]|uniref:glucosaminidase domain-containing protein n=1 Tax=Thalassotalea ponticola TaxID=1523392 RepID=UPI0025B614DD|nr:glucosaminidase domain-containing protein [Thalassotalea ponticola]MDN3651400.1 glucosaminidase domain-containing protein [Thalassotalea ponticola]